MYPKLPSCHFDNLPNQTACQSWESPLRTLRKRPVDQRDEEKQVRSAGPRGRAERCTTIEFRRSWAFSRRGQGGATEGSEACPPLSLQPVSPLTNGSCRQDDLAREGCSTSRPSGLKRGKTLDILSNTLLALQLLFFQSKQITGKMKWNRASLYGNVYRSFFKSLILFPYRRNICTFTSWDWKEQIQSEVRKVGEIPASSPPARIWSWWGAVFLFFKYHHYWGIVCIQ